MSRELLANEVNIDLGDDVSVMLYEAAKMTWDNRPGMIIEIHSSFSGWRAIRPDFKPADCYESMGSDGIGTKVEVAERLEDHSTIAYDLFAMACDDAVVRGAEPVAINTVLDVNALVDNDVLTEKSIRQLAAGYIGAAQEAGVAVLNGETAELGSRVGGYGDFNYNWCGTVLWYAQRDRILTGLEIKPGDVLIGLAEKGFRSNGITDVRNAMLKHYGNNWHNLTEHNLGSVALGHLVMQPSTIYTRFITSLTGGFNIDNEPRAKISGIAHITGGGQPSKLGRMLEPSGLGAVIDDPIEPPEIMKYVQNLRSFDDKIAYGKWHMGTGMIISTPEPHRVMDEAHKADVEAQIIGYINDKSGIFIKNRGVVQQEEWLIFDRNV